MASSLAGLQEIGGIPFLIERELLGKGILVAFSTRLGGVSAPPYSSLNVAFHVDDAPERVLSNRQLLFRALGLGEKSPIFAEQVHGLTVARVGSEDRGRGVDSAADSIQGTDALITVASKTPLSILTADCVPIALVDPITPSVAAVHAGWRGTIGEIAARTVSEMVALGSKREDILAYLGPSIGPCCYEVGKELAAEFRRAFGKAVTPAEGRLDLRLANSLALQEAGLRLENIHDSDYCTSCRKDLFFSYRAESGTTGRQCVVTAILG